MNPKCCECDIDVQGEKNSDGTYTCDKHKFNCNECGDCVCIVNRATHFTTSTDEIKSFKKLIDFVNLIITAWSFFRNND
jgi:hypothetical protein